MAWAYVPQKSQYQGGMGQPLVTPGYWLDSTTGKKVPDVKTTASGPYGGGGTTYKPAPIPAAAAAELKAAQAELDKDPQYSNWKTMVNAGGRTLPLTATELQAYKKWVDSGSPRLAGPTWGETFKEIAGVVGPFAAAIGGAAMLSGMGAGALPSGVTPGSIAASNAAGDAISGSLAEQMAGGFGAGATTGAGTATGALTSTLAPTAEGMAGFSAPVEFGGTGSAGVAAGGAGGMAPVTGALTPALAPNAEGMAGFSAPVQYGGTGSAGVSASGAGGMAGWLEKLTGIVPSGADAATKTAALAKAGLTPQQIATATAAPGMIDKLISGTATATDLAKIGLTAAGLVAVASENPDRTSSTKVEYPDWYNSASKSAIGLADKYAALGPNSVAPLSANENQAIKLAQTSAGDWQPLMDKSVSSLDAALPYYTKAGESADSVKGYLDRSGALANEAAGGIPSIDLSKYMNPYLDNVLTPIARRNEIAKASTLADISAKAGMRGAFGGSRNDLLTNLASESADRNMNEAEANIRSGAFTTGLTAAQSDLQRKLAASGQFGTLGNVADNTSTAYTNIGRSLTDTAGGYKADAGALGTLTDADIARLTSTGQLGRSVEQAKLNAPLTAIGGYANALRGNPGSVTTNVAPEASKTGQVVGALTALAGANKAGWI